VKGEEVGHGTVLLNGERQSLPEGTYDWQQVSLAVTTGTDQDAITVQINCGDVTESLWIDDIRLVETGSDENVLDNPSFDAKAYEINQENLDSFTSMLETAAENDIAVSALIQPHPYPGWAYERWPDMRAEPTGHFIMQVIDHPKARELEEAYLRAVIPAIKDYDSLHSIALANEPGYWSQGDRWTKQQWPQYLKEEYGDIETLNTVYDTDFDTFASITPGPNNLNAHPRTYDWAQFNNERFTEYMQWRADIIDEEAPDVPLHIKLLPYVWSKRQSLINTGIDPERMATVTDINGNDGRCWPDEGTKGFLQYMALYDLQRSIETAPVFNSENHLIRDGSDNYDPMIANHVRTGIWQGAIHGCSASTMWLWQRTHDPEDSWGGNIAHRPLAVAKFGHTTLDMNRLADEVTAFQMAESDVAILYSDVAHVFSKRYAETLLECYGSLSFAGQKIDFATEPQIQDGQLADYEMVVIPHAPAVEAETLSGLAEFVDAGGTAIVVGEDSLKSDPQLQSLPVEERATVVDSARTVPVNARTETLREAIREPLNPSVRVVDAETGDIREGVEWRTVEFDGRTHVAIANYTVGPVRLTIEDSGTEVDSAHELLSGEEHSFPAEIRKRTPALFKLP
jgi:hypothetical protein